MTSDSTATTGEPNETNPTAETFPYYATGFNVGKYHLVDPDLTEEADPGAEVDTLCAFSKQGVVPVDSPEAAHTLLADFCGHCANAAVLPDNAIDHLRDLAAQYDSAEPGEAKADGERATIEPEDGQLYTAADFEALERPELRALATHTEVNGNLSTAELRAGLTDVAPVVVEAEAEDE